MLIDYLKSNHKSVVEDVFKEELEATFLNRFRNNPDIQQIVFSYYPIAKKKKFDLCKS